MYFIFLQTTVSGHIDILIMLLSYLFSKSMIEISEN